MHSIPLRPRRRLFATVSVVAASLIVFSTVAVAADAPPDGPGEQFSPLPEWSEPDRVPDAGLGNGPETIGAETADWVPFVGEYFVECTMGNPDPWGVGICASHHSYTGAVDLDMPSGTPVFAAGPGEVVYVNDTCQDGDTFCEGGAGKWVGIAHADGKVSRYMHLDKVLVDEGDDLARGQQLGTAGITGNATGPHLHYDEQKPLWDRDFIETMYACHDDDVVVYPDSLGYSDWEDVPYGTYLRNDGYACSGGPPPPCAGDLCDIEPPAGFSLSPVTVNGTYVPLTGDFDGDGEDDVFWYAAGSASDYVWFGSPGGSFSSVAVSVNGAYVPVTGDFDGDGFDDVFWYRAGSGRDYIWSGTSTRGVFSSAVTGVNGTYVPVAGDFDGDGFGDVFWYAAGSAKDYVWFGSSGGVFSSVLVAVSGFYVPVAGDFDGDGFDDLLWYGPDSVQDSFWYGASTGYEPSVPADIGGTFDPFSADFDGNGAFDVFWYRSGSLADAVWFAD